MRNGTESLISRIRRCDRDKPYVFISYSNRDWKRVSTDVIELQSRGYNVWIDEANLDKTKRTWKEDALGAIRDINCLFLIFYVSRSSLTSANCLDEVRETYSAETVRTHFEELKYICVDVEPLGDIMTTARQIAVSIRRDENLTKEQREKKTSVLTDFVRDIFDSNNERIRVHPIDEPERKSDYYTDILSSLPTETRNQELPKQEPAPPLPPAQPPVKEKSSGSEPVREGGNKPESIPTKTERKMTKNTFVRVGIPVLAAVLVLTAFFGLILPAVLRKSVPESPAESRVEDPVPAAADAEPVIPENEPVEEADEKQPVEEPEPETEAPTEPEPEIESKPEPEPAEPDPVYQVTVQATPNGTVSAEPTSGTAGTKITIKAVPAEGYEFVSWDTAQKLELPADREKNSFILQEDAEITAVFVLKEQPAEPDPVFKVNLLQDANGSITASPESGTAGTKITIKAVPNEGYDFVSWDEGPALDSASDNARNSFILEGDVTLSATFAHKPVTITIRNAEHGTVTAGRTEAKPLEWVSLNVVPEQNYVLERFDVLEGGVTLGPDSTGFTAGNAPVVIQPVFVLEVGKIKASGKCGDTVTWTLTTDGVLTIGGEGRMNDYGEYMTTDNGERPWDDYKDNIVGLRIDRGITYIGRKAFYNLRALQGTIELPDTVEVVGEYAFDMCIGFTGKLTFPDSLKEIREGAFANCTGLSGSIIFPNHLTTIGNYAFLCNTELGFVSSLTGDIDIPASVTSIGIQAFGGCGKIGKNVYIRGDSVKMGSWVFNNCKNITNVYFYGMAPVTEGSWPMNPSTQAQDLKLYCTSANIASFRSSDIYNSWNNTWSGCPLAEFTP